ncbi:conserved hypothetical protein, partial [Ricinus communis]
MAKPPSCWSGGNVAARRRDRGHVVEHRDPHASRDARSLQGDRLPVTQHRSGAAAHRQRDLQARGRGAHRIRGGQRLPPLFRLPRPHVEG